MAFIGRAILFALAFALLSLSALPGFCGTDSHIHVRPAEVISHPSPCMYGPCIEDVNHEIYGGLYAQRIFGESFEEPPTLQLPGWNGFGGMWQIRDRSLATAADAGAKMVRSGPAFADGSAAVDVKFSDAQGDNAGLILRV